MRIDKTGRPALPHPAVPVLYPQPKTSPPSRPRIELTMKIFAMGAVALISVSLTACNTEQRSPDQIRKETASATATAARDAKAVAQGVVDGLKHGGTVNINKASETDLEKLPGIDETAARRIIANRPYETSGELTRKHVISKSEYDHIADNITVQ